MIHRWLSLLLVSMLIGLLTACREANPPLEFAPNGEIVKEAIALQLRQTLNPLSQQLKANRPELEISQINVKKLEPIVVADLPTYHLEGTYNLKLILPRQEVTQKKNQFGIYLQRQAEGKTWRLLSREGNNSSPEPQWKSYLIRLNHSSKKF